MPSFARAAPGFMYPKPHRTIAELKAQLIARGIYFRSNLRHGELLELLEPVELAEEVARKKEILDLFEEDKAPQGIEADVSYLPDVPESEDSDQEYPGEEFTISTSYTKYGTEFARGHPLERGYTLVNGAGFTEVISRIRPGIASIRISEVLDWGRLGWNGFFGYLYQVSQYGQKEGKGRWRIRSLAIVGCQIGSSEERYKYIFDCLTDWLPHLPYLTHISLGSNQLTQLPERFTRMLVKSSRPIRLTLSTNRLSPAWISSFALLLSENPTSYGIRSLNFQYNDVSKLHIPSLTHLFCAGRSLPPELHFILGCGLTLRQWEQILGASGLLAEAPKNSSLTSLDWDSIHIVDWSNTSSLRMQLAEAMRLICSRDLLLVQITRLMAPALLQAIRSFVHFPSRSRPALPMPIQQEPLPSRIPFANSTSVALLTPRSTSPLHDPPTSLSASTTIRQNPPPPPPAPRVGFPFRLPTEIVFLIADQLVDSALSQKQIWSILAYATDRETLSENKMEKTRKKWLRKMDCERWESNEPHRVLDIGS